MSGGGGRSGTTIFFEIGYLPASKFEGGGPVEKRTVYHTYGSMGALMTRRAYVPIYIEEI